MRTLVNRPDRSRELLHAFVAAIEACAGRLAVDLVGAADRAAMRAYRAIRPADRFEMLSCGGFVVENRVCKVDGQLRAPGVRFLSHFRICLSSA